MSMLSILNTGRMGLIANQTALSVTGNNISNVNTTGYTRQRADFQTVSGGGVNVINIDRLRDDFLGSRLQDANTEVGGNTLRADNLKAIESLMDETDDSGLSQDIQNFFSAMQDLTLNPSGTTERDMVRSRAQQLATSLAGLASQLTQSRQQLDQQLTQGVTRVNTLTTGIAKLNQQISELGGQSATQSADRNQMLDQRDRLVNELSGFMPVKVLKNENGMLTVFGSGELLVEGSRQRPLVTVADPANGNLAAVAIKNENGTLTSLMGKLKKGSLGATLQVRDGDAAQALGQVNRLAAELARSVNVQHRAGTGLDGSTGQDFFSGLTTTTASAWQNKGGATVSASAITDESQLTFDDYQIRFTAAGQFDVLNASTGATVSSGNAYTPGAAIALPGMTLTLDNKTGAPAAGDSFTINAYDGTAGRLALSAAVATDPRALAAGQSTAAGDNQNATALAGLGNKSVLGNPPSMTFEDYYHQARGTLSIAAQSAETARSNGDITQQQIQGMVDAVSGVSVDEEATKIIQFQRGFQAASRIVSTTDELMQSLISMLG